jgi:pimeloyl-ACP methyl ester carboxylesterase
MPGQRPPVKEEPKRIVLKMLVLVLLLAGAGIAIWNASVEQRINLTEVDTISDLGLDPDVLATVGGRNIYVVERSQGAVPVILLHGFEVSGSVLMEPVAEAIGGNTRVVTIDLPGMGLSSRISDPGPEHTVGGMGRAVIAILEDRYQTPVVIAGVGLGGEVAAEVAATRPDLVRGVVLVDVDFWPGETWRERTQRLPFVGRAMTFQNESSGPGSIVNWAPHCADGGWCPTSEQNQRRRVTATLQGTTASLNAFRHTPRSSFVPEDLDKITAPVAYIWSTRGRVPSEHVERVASAVSQMTRKEVEVFQAHLEAPDDVAAAVAEVIARS